MSTATCPAIGCGRPAAIRGYCRAHYDRRRKLGQFGFRDATEIQAHLRTLRARGWTHRATSDASGVSRPTVLRLLRGAPMVRRDVADALLQIPPVWRPSRVSVDVAGVRRRYDALRWKGWTGPQIAAHMGVPWATLRMAVYMRESTSAAMACRMAEVYDRLSGVQGPSSRAATRARNAGVAPPAAWDEDTIDDPRARPSGVPRPARGAA